MTGSFTPPLVYFFGQGRADGTAAMKEVLGGKGAGLAEMTTLGIPVPPGFTITTTICLQYLEAKQFSPRLKAQVEQALQRLENATGRSFGDRANPLLVSVRSGAPVSMPGMMETILNLGLNDETVEGLAQQSGNPHVRLGQLPPLRADVRERRLRPARRRPSSTCWMSSVARRASPATSTCRCRCSRRWCARSRPA